MPKVTSTLVSNYYLLSSESKTQLVNQIKQNPYRRAYIYIYIYIYVYIYVYICIYTCMYIFIFINAEPHVINAEDRDKCICRKLPCPTAKSSQYYCGLHHRVTHRKQPRPLADARINLERLKRVSVYCASTMQYRLSKELHDISKAMRSRHIINTKHISRL